MQHFFRRLAIVAPLALATTGAHADVTISSGKTQNITCSSGVCAPTATSAVLNVKDLQTLLASGNVEVTTTGSGVQANNIVVTAKLSWSNSSVLALDAYDSITVNDPVAITGKGGLTLTTNDGGTGGLLSFGAKGNATFTNLSSKLTINGVSYTLVNTVAGLAKGVAKSPDGNFALAKSYNAKHDGTYATSPIPTTFGGFFEGLGNEISNLSVFDPISGDSVGLFADVTSATIADLGLTNVSIGGTSVAVGSLVAVASGATLAGDFVTGQVSSNYVGAYIGGICGECDATISNLYSGAAVTGGDSAWVGGLAGAFLGTMSGSYATGTVTGGNGKFNSDEYVGGLIGQNGGTISNSYATATATGGSRSSSVPYTLVGGLIGQNYGTISNSYATGSVAGGDVTAGGLVGQTDGGSISNSYATGAVSAAGWAGGLVGWNSAPISNSYATGEVAGPGQIGDACCAFYGGLVGYNESTTISNSNATGSVTATGSNGDDLGAYIGGLVGYNESGTLTDTFATGSVSAIDNGGSASGYASVGGLVGNSNGNNGTAGAINTSFATGSVTASNSASAYIGGLVGYEYNESYIANCYSTTGAVTGGTDDYVGGLVGGLFLDGAIATSYSTGAVTSGSGSDIGGLVGFDGNTSQEIVDAYWDTTTSGVTNKSQGAGNIANDPGIEGLSTKQFQSGLPGGFESTVWKEKSKVNDGFPYLIDNPPPE